MWLNEPWAFRRFQNAGEQPFQIDRDLCIPNGPMIRTIITTISIRYYPDSNSITIV